MNEVIAEPTPDAKRSRFQWNKGAWFGSQIGVSCWLVPFGLLVAPVATDLALVTGGAFLGLNILGFRLWSQRERRRAYIATQLLLAGSSIANAAVILFAQQFNEELRKIGSGTNVSVEVPLVLIFISPVLMLMFFVQERLSRR